MATQPWTREATGQMQRPRWLRRLWFLGPAPPLTPEESRMLGAVGAASLFANYGLSLLGLALPQIQRGLGIAEAQLGGLTAVVQLGVIPAFGLSVLADHLGRRRLLLVTIFGCGLTTALTGLVRTGGEFVVLQLLARVFIAAEGMFAVVVIAEEFDAGIRGWGIGMATALGALGHGLGALVFSTVNVLPFGWRALYVCGGAPLLLVPWFVRTLAETRRFTSQRAGRMAAGLAAALRPLHAAARMYPGRMLALCAALFPCAFVFETATLFQAKFLQDVHRYSPANVALLYLTVGALVPIGNVSGGALGDRFGRKRIAIAALLLNAAAIALFYNATRWLVPLAWGLMMLTLTMVLLLFAALGSELFPTSYRSTAAGVRAVTGALGAAAGLWVEGRLYGRAGGHAAAITWMLAVTPVAPLIVAFFLPETASRELEDIAPERGGAGVGV